MSNARYEFEMYIITKEDPKNKDKSIERLNIPVHSFEVDGGAKRKLNLKEIDEISVSSEFEQARMFKNIIFYIPPTKDFLALKIIDLRSPMISFFEMTFVVNIYSGGMRTQTLRFHNSSAWFVRVPAPVGSTPPLLKAEVHFHSENTQLMHGKYDTKRKKIVHKEI